LHEFEGHGARGLSPLGEGFRVLGFAHVGVAGDHLVAVPMGEEVDEDRGVETPGVRQYDLFLHGRPFIQIARSSSAISSGEMPFFGAMKIVSSPAIVPASPGMRLWSSARPTEGAAPGGVWTTTSASVSSTKRTEPATARSASSASTGSSPSTS